MFDGFCFDIFGVLYSRCRAKWMNFNPLALELNVHSDVQKIAICMSLA
jgi:hypothetical protein